MAPFAEYRVGPGWLALATELDEQLRLLQPPGELVEIALDYAGLPCFRARLPKASRAQGRALVRTYETRACGQCELCGRTGRLRGGVVVTVRCEDCV